MSGSSFFFTFLSRLPPHIYHPKHPLLHCAGALGYVPLCFVLPCVLYLRARRGALAAREVAASWAVICVSAAVMCLAAIGSLRSLIVSSGAYKFFS